MLFPIRNTFPTTRPKAEKKIKGLGDVVAIVAEPIKQTIMKHSPQIVKETLRKCNCDKRKEWLNKHFPLK